MRRSSPQLLLAIALLFTGCRGCERTPRGAILELAPPTARAVAVVPDLAEAAAGLQAFIQRASAGSPDAIKRVREALAQQLGFDALEADDYAKAGLEPRGGALVFTESLDGAPLLALAVKDKTKFDTWLAALVERVDGASEVKSETSGGHTYKTAGRPFGGELAPVLHWAHTGGYVVLARSEALAGLQAALVRLAAPKETRPTLTTDPVWRAVDAKVQGGALRIFARAEATAPGAPPISAGMLTAVRADGKGASLESFVGLTVEGLDAALGSAPPLELARRVEDDAVAVLLTRAARPEGLSALERQPLIKTNVDRALEPLAREVGLDLRKDVLPLFAGPLTAAVHIMDLGGLPQAVAQRRSINALLDFVHVSVSAELKDPAAMITVLDRSKAELAKRGIDLRRREVTVEGKPAVVFEPNRDPAPLGWGVIGNLYVYGAGVGRLERAMAHAVASKPSTVASKLTGGVGERLAKGAGATVVVVRSSAIAEHASRVFGGEAGRALPLGAFVGSAVELLRKLGDVALAVTPEQGGLRLVVREELR